MEEPFYKNPFCDEMLYEPEYSPRLFPMGIVELTTQPPPIVFEINSAGGNLKCTYDPAPVIDELIKYFDWFSRPPASYLAEYMEKNQCSEDEAREILVKNYIQSMETSISDAVRMSINTARNYIAGVVDKQLPQALWISLDRITGRVLELGGRGGIPLEEVKISVSHMIKEYRQLLKQALDLSIQGGKRISKFDWDDEKCEEFAKLHEEKRQLWKKAKSLRKSGTKRWRAEVRKLDPSTPNSLLNRMAKSQPYVSSASNLALHHAALVLGIKIGTYSQKQLEKYRKKGREILNQKAVWNFKVRV
jgi:hypothetical protein